MNRAGHHGRGASYAPAAATGTTAGPAVPSRSASAAMVARPAIAAPAKARAGTEIRLSGSGFRAGSEVRIVLDTPAHLVQSVLAEANGTFQASVVVPRHVALGAHRLQVEGTGSVGDRTSLATHVVILGTDLAVATKDVVPSLAEPVLLTIAVILPLSTWLALEMLGWRRRRSPN